MTDCPSSQVLEAFENGEIVGARAEALKSHLARCTACREMIKRHRHIHAASRGSTVTIGHSGERPSGDSLAEPSESPDPGSDDTEDTMTSTSFEAELTGTAGGRRPRTARASPSSALDGDWPITDYERVVLCGEGSYGSVWVVRDRAGVYRAMKVIDLDQMKRAQIRCRETDALEAYCQKVNRHAHLITIFHIGMTGPLLYYTMELADDRGTRRFVHDKLPENYHPMTLQSAMGTDPLPVDGVIELIRRLLRGLVSLHAAGLVHRDIKPSNVIFVNRQPKLADIGILTRDDGSRRIVGTPRYMPPDRVMDKTADTFAIGKVLHEMLAGRTPEAFPELPERIRWGSMQWDLERMNTVLMKACAPRAEDRYPNAAAMLEDLEASARLGFDSLFDEVRRRPHEKEDDLGVRLAFAFARNIPWLLAFIAVLYLIARLT